MSPPLNDESRVPPPGFRPLQAAAINGTPSLTDSRVSVRAVVDLAAWRRLRRAPAGGDWWGGRRMWTWAEAERSLGRWSA
jgi:hypothetical protein